MRNTLRASFSLLVLGHAAFACRQPLFSIPNSILQLGNVTPGSPLAGITINAMTTDYDGVADSGGGTPGFTAFSNSPSILALNSITTSPNPPAYGRSQIFTF